MYLFYCDQLPLALPLINKTPPLIRLILPLSIKTLAVVFAKPYSEVAKIFTEGANRVNYYYLLKENNMLNKIVSNRKYIWIASLSFSSVCFIGNFVATGNLLDSVFTQVMSMIVIFLGYRTSWPFYFYGIRAYFKNPMSPPYFFLDTCRFFTYFFVGASVFRLACLLVASLSWDTENLSSGDVIEVFIMPGFPFGSGIGFERHRKIIASKYPHSI
jgi:hypothetical protein